MNAREGAATQPRPSFAMNDWNITMSESTDPDNRDPIDNFAMQLEIAKYQASQKRFSDAYLTLAAAYQNLIEQHEQAIEEVLALRKKLADEIYNRELWRKKATGI